MTEKRIRVLIVDDHPVVRKGLRQVLEIEDDIEVIGEADNGESGIELAKQLKPTIVLIDLVMPGMDGVEAIRKIKKILPDIRIVVLTSYHEDAMVIPAVKAGALSYLLKSSSSEDLLDAIRAAVKLEARLHPRVLKKLMQDVSGKGPSLDTLTARELEILKLIAKGLGNRAISEKLFVSEKTVKTHVSNLLSKLGLSDRTQAAIYALRQRIVPLSE